MSLESITLTPDSLEALLAATGFYAEFLRNHLHDDGGKPEFLKMPGELKKIFERRIDLCEQLKRTFDGIAVDRRIDLAFSKPEPHPTVLVDEVTQLPTKRTKAKKHG